MNSYEEDVWTEIAKFLDGRSLVMLAVTCKWFSRLMMEDSVWKYACLRDLQVPDPGDVSVKWIKLYAAAFGIFSFFHARSSFDVEILHTSFQEHAFADGSHTYMFHQQEKHIGEALLE